jgi:spore coat protein H
MKNLSSNFRMIINILITTGLCSYTLSGQSEYPTLKLEDTGKKIENTIQIQITASEYEYLQVIPGSKMSLKVKTIIINGDSITPEDVTTRGQSTLQFRRKSLGFKLKTDASFRHGDKSMSLKKFSVLNLAMDKYYTHNRLAFGLMEKAGIFNLFYSFCELSINDRSQGIFMVIEKPEDWARNSKNSPLVIRRGYDHRIDKMATENKSDKAETNKYLDYYKQIYKALNKYEGEELYRKLTEYIDLDFYMKWLAFNFLVHNGDYSDEVFFYIDPEIKKFRIVPWDYDDIFAIQPHEGKEASKKVLGDKLLFSSEDMLDKKIASDPFLYNAYLKNMKEVLETLSVDYIKKVCEDVYSELFPYYSREEIIQNSQYDLFKDASPDNLRSYLLVSYLGLSSTRDRYLKQLSKVE